MNTFRALLCAIASLAIACSNNAFVTTDASNGDVPQATDAADVHTPMDVAHPTDVPTSDVTATDVAHPIDAITGADARDTSTGVDVPVSTDGGTPVDAPMSTDVVTPADVPMTTDVVAPPDAGAACTDDTDCGGAGLECAYLISDACSAVGTCVVTPAPMPCFAITLLSGCGCSGTTVTWTGGCRPEYPDGYAPAPITHMGACP